MGRVELTDKKEITDEKLLIHIVRIPARIRRMHERCGRRTIAPAPDGNTQVVLTGFSGRGTRTGFGGAEDGAVPFLWSAGDYIWARNTRSEAIAEGGSQADDSFSNPSKRPTRTTYSTT